MKRNISVQPMYNKLGHRRASAILGFQAQTGKDMSGRFARRTSEWCFKVFMACDDDTRQLYTSKVYTKVNDFRWFLYSNRAAEGSVPPTTGPLTLESQRAHYVANIWRKAGEIHPRLPSPVDCGWEIDTTRHHYTPVRCLNPPAPATVMDLVKCGFK